MSRVITFSTKFPAYHPRAGEPTFFVEKLMAGFADIIEDWIMPQQFRHYDFHEYYSSTPKFHTIRAGNRWKVGDKFSPRIWSGKPYNSPQLIFSPDIEIKKVFDFGIDPFSGQYFMDTVNIPYNKLTEIARNDGFSDLDDFELWFREKRSSPGFRGQIICWNDNINY